MLRSEASYPFAKLVAVNYAPRFSGVFKERFVMFELIEKYWIARCKKHAQPTENGVLVDGHFYKETDEGYEQALAVLGARRVEK